MLLLFSLFFFSLILADDDSHKWAPDEEITIWVNKVGPYHNPQETYDYYSLPFCKPGVKKIRHKSNSLGVVLEGNELYDSGLRVKFKVPQKSATICELKINEKVSKIFNGAVNQHYWYQMYIDELPVWGFVGFSKEETRGIAHKNSLNNFDNLNSNNNNNGFIYTHSEFTIGYNGDRIIEVNLTQDNLRPIAVGEVHPITLTLNWVETNKKFASRFDRYLDFDFFEHQIHWFSVLNSVMMVIFLCGVVALILMRTLKADYARISKEDQDLELDRVVEESGWKQVHGDVFRAPPYLSLYSALVGSGCQLVLLAFCALLLTLVGSTYDERGTMTTALLVFYSLTSFAAGFAGGSFYKLHDGQHWKQAMTLTATLFPGICLLILVMINTIAIYYNSLSALSIATLMYMFSIWLFISAPLVVFGTIIGRSLTVEKDFPCRINYPRRPIPSSKWFNHPVPLALFSGVLPFGSIFIEMYFVFTAFWNYKFYYVYGFMLLVYVILIIVTVCVTIVSTYFLLNAEDYRWHWTAFCSGGSTALYVYLYAIYYFFAKTHMSGALQTCFYFGYMLILCLGLFLLCGTIAYYGTNLFVRKIYHYIKSE